MGMKIPQPGTGGGDFQPAPAGNHLATCYQVIDLGTQMESFGSDPAKPTHKIMITWELPDELREDGKPFSLNKRYTFSMHEKASLRHDLESWRGKPFSKEEFGTFDIANLLGVNCMLNVVHEVKSSDKGTRTIAKVSSVAATPKGMPKKADKTINDRLDFNLEDFDVRAYDMMPDWLKELIAKSPEYAHATGNGPAMSAHDTAKGNAYQPDDDLNDVIPF